jgi:hypothetical protein
MTFLSWGIGVREEEFQTTDGQQNSPNVYGQVEPHVLGLPGDRALLAWWEARDSASGHGSDLTIYAAVGSVSGTTVTLGSRQVVWQITEEDYNYNQWSLSDIGNGMFACSFVHQHWDSNTDYETFTLFRLDGDTINVLDTWVVTGDGTMATAIIPLAPGKFLRQRGTFAQYVDCSSGLFAPGASGTVNGPIFPSSWWSDGVKALSMNVGDWGFVGGNYTHFPNTSAYLMNVNGPTPSPVGSGGLPVGGDSLIDPLPTTHVPTLDGGAVVALGNYQFGDTPNVTLARVTVVNDALVTNETYLVAPAQDSGYGGNNQTAFLPRAVGSDGAVYLLSGTTDAADPTYGVTLHTDVFANPEIVRMPDDGIYAGLNARGGGWKLGMASTETGVWAVVGTDIDSSPDGLVRRALTLTWMPLAQPAISGDYIGARRRFRRL